MYLKDKLYRITLRLNEAQFQHVKANSDLLGVSPSEFLRMVINVTMASSKSMTSDIENLKKEGVSDCENDSIDNNDNE